MQLWILRPKIEDDPIFSYDCQHGAVVRAASEPEARAIADKRSGYEGDAWLHAERTTCEALEPDGEPSFIIQDFHAG